MCSASAVTTAPWSGNGTSRWGNFVISSFFFNLDLTDHYGLLMQYGTEQVGRSLAVIVASAQCFAVNSHRASGQRIALRHPATDLLVQSVGLEPLQNASDGGLPASFIVSSYVLSRDNIAELVVLDKYVYPLDLLTLLDLRGI